MSERVVYIVRSWPRLSQTFIVNEVLALERRGVDLAIFSLVRSEEYLVQSQVGQVRAPVRYLADDLAKPWARRVRIHLAACAADPARYLRVLLFCLSRPGLAAGYGECSTLRCFTHAVMLGARFGAMRDEPVRVHAHFAHDPALVGLLVSKLTGLPFSFTAHARDLVQIPPASLAARTAAATTVVTCCQENAEYLHHVVPEGRRPPVRVVHHGVDLDRFRPVPRGPDVAVPRLVSVGRLVEKKGHVDLLHALAGVAATGRPFRCDIYGDGPLWHDLRALRDTLSLEDQVRFVGPRSNDRIRRALDHADAFVLTPRVTSDGDRDGIPNVLVEAMACGLPVVTTSAGGTAELVQHERNGLLCPPGEPPAIAAALCRLLDDGELRARFGSAARATVEDDYDVDAAAGQLEELLLPGTEVVLA
jgi:glycosyltransferase involved in cell wall biosynthesis